jgi:hypothetical protein
MLFPVPFARPEPVEEPPAFVRLVTHSDVQWNRRTFRAPPLDVQAPAVVIAPKSVKGKKTVQRSR